MGKSLNILAIPSEKSSPKSMYMLYTLFQLATTVLLLKHKVILLFQCLPWLLTSLSPSPYHDQSSWETPRLHQPYSAVTTFNSAPVLIHSVLAVLAYLLFLEHSKRATWKTLSSDIHVSHLTSPLIL